MVLSVSMPHNGRDEEDYIEALGAVRNIMTEGRKTGADDLNWRRHQHRKESWKDWRGPLAAQQYRLVWYV